MEMEVEIKKPLAVLSILSAGVLASQAAVHINGGDWADASPESTSSDTVWMNQGGTATVTHSGEVCNDLRMVNGSSYDVLNVLSGSLDVSTLIGVSWSGTGTAELNISGGTVNANQLFVGYVGSGTGLVTIFGGDVDITSDITLDLYGSGSYGLTVVGSDASISAGSVSVGNDGTLTFVLDENGVSSLEVAGALNGSAGSLVVDGFGYTGGAANFVLVDAGSVSMPSAGNISVVGFENASVSQVGNTIVLSVVSSQTDVTFDDTTSDGLWNTAGNWSSASVPADAVNAVIDGSVPVTVASDAPYVKMVTTVGDSGESNPALIVDADLDVSHLRVAANYGSFSIMGQWGGDLNVSSAFELASTESGSDSGFYIISGGSLDFSGATLSVGTQGTGFFAVNGSFSDSVIGSHLNVGPYGGLDFYLDAGGSTAMTLDGDVNFNGGSITIDGTDYKGMDCFIPQIWASDLTNAIDTNDVTLTGFDSSRKAETVIDSTGLFTRMIPPTPFSDELCSLIPESTVATDWGNTTFSASRDYSPSGSEWGIDISEGHVMGTRLTQTVIGEGADVRSWDMRLGRSGFIYSLITPALGETVPHQPSTWNDEVWQMVAVSFDYQGSGYNNYHMHQAGVYNSDPILTKPFYSPQVASYLNESDRSFTVISWPSATHIYNYTDEDPGNDFETGVLMYTRYRDLGQGVIEVTCGMYNYGPDSIGQQNMPWGSVRESSTEYSFWSDVGGTSWTSNSAYFAGTGDSKDLDETGGWVGYSKDPNGTTEALGMVYGMPYSGADFVRCGKTGRDSSILTVIRRTGLTQGMGAWSRYYFTLGDDMQDLSDRIADRELVDAEYHLFDYTEESTPLIGYSVTGSGVDFRVAQDNDTPDFSLYAHPVTGSFPVFEIIENDDSRYLTWNPYANDIVKPYDGTIANILLLGYAMPSAGSEGTYADISTLLPAENYFADGETLYVRMALLMVDIGRSDQSAIEDGWQGWEMNGSSSYNNQSKSFSFADTTDGTLDVTISASHNYSVRNYGIDHVTDPGNLDIPSVWSDQWFGNNASADFSVVLDDLKAGTYTFTSYHYADDLQEGGGWNDEATASVYVNGVDASQDVTFVTGNPYSTSPSAADIEAEGILVLSFTVSNDNDTVTIKFDDLTGGDSFGLNGFELVPFVD